MFRKAFFYRHSKNRCQASVVSRPEPVAVPNVRGACDPQWPKLLAEMDRDAILEVVAADPTILRLGKKHIRQAKTEEGKGCTHQSAGHDASDGAIAAAGERSEDGRGPVGRLQFLCVARCDR